jgi:hypothetical protein
MVGYRSTTTPLLTPAKCSTIVESVGVRAT